MTKVVLNNLTTLSPGSAITVLNNNFDTIETAFDNTLSRDGTSPNQMLSHLDMNSFRIQNLVIAVSDTEPVRLREFIDEMDALELTVQTIASTTQGYLNQVIEIYNTFDNRYLGIKTSDPTVDNDGAPLVVGTLYFNTTVSLMRVYTATGWASLVTVTSVLSIDDLSDVSITAAVAGDILRHNGVSWVDYPDSNYQPVDSDLTAIAALTTTSYGRSFLTQADASSARTLIGSVIGTDVQAFDADLATIAGLTATTDNFIQSKSSAWASRTVAQVKTDLGLTGTNSGDQSVFSTVAVSGQSDVVADTTTDTLTLVAGSNITLTTDASADSVTIAASAGSSPVVIKKSADQSVASTTLTNDTDFTFALAANTKYLVDLHLDCTHTSAEDFKFDITGPASPTSVSIFPQATYVAAAVPANSAVADAPVNAFSTALVVQIGAGPTGLSLTISVYINNGANSGTFQFRWANSTTATSRTVRALSFMKYQVVS